MECKKILKFSQAFKKELVLGEKNRIEKSGVNTEQECSVPLVTWL